MQHSPRKWLSAGFWHRGGKESKGKWESDAAIGYLFPLRQVGAHQALKKLAMVVHAEVKELVDDDHPLKGAILTEEIFTETDASAGRARSPFLRHGLDLDT
ncbi:protein of unknown function [Candidatus Methylomirabilis oxygeniifera]|uniref:Uncharacterized protein n=1 Tax=Methylomirabilis oxygeniifera TaxID=671143 RepID=D5MIL2_METO1|nr:protein of unknown function [Candidatus Methylomirabilis oxyfera]